MKRGLTRPRIYERNNKKELNYVKRQSKQRESTGHPMVIQ